MTTADLTRLIFKRLKKFRYIILAAGLIVGVLLYLYAKRTPVTFTSRATVFPLTSSPENSGASSALSVLLGTDSKNFSDDASINIVELAKSRTTREAVAATVIPSMGNKTIAALLAEDINNHLSWMERKIIPPAAHEIRGRGRRAGRSPRTGRGRRCAGTRAWRRAVQAAVEYRRPGRRRAIRVTGDRP